MRIIHLKKTQRAMDAMMKMKKLDIKKTNEAAKAFPEVAKGMNAAEKIVFSRKLKKADWNNTTVIKGDLIEEVKKLKKQQKKTQRYLAVEQS